MKNALQNKTFWKNIKPLFSNKWQVNQKITIVEGNNIIETEDEVAETFNDFFKNAINDLGIQ